MIDLASADERDTSFARLGGQPIALTAAALLLLIAGVTTIAIWRAYTGAAPEPDRVVATRLLQARTAQASEQLVEKTKGLEVTQQESIDGLRQSFASARATEAETPTVTRRKPARHRVSASARKRSRG